MAPPGRLAQMSRGAGPAHLPQGGARGSRGPHVKGQPSRFVIGLVRGGDIDEGKGC